MTNTYTETAVLNAAGIGGEGQTLTDNARAAGIIAVCLGCGSTTGINPADLGPHPDVETARAATRDNIDRDWLDCCPDADSIVY